MHEGELVITASGYKKIEAELEEIYTVTKPQVVDRVRQARLLGDLRENADYHDAKHARAMLEARVMELKHILGTAKVVPDSQFADDCVQIGCTVKVMNLTENEEEEYMIVGPSEADPLEGKISNRSTLGAALLGHSPGDEVEIAAPMGIIQYRITAVGC